MPMVIQRKLMHQPSKALKPRANRPGPCCLCLMVLGRISTPSNGVKITATIQDTISDTAITTNRVKVNSPAALLLSPMGMKLATVTRVPVSMGKAVEV